MDGINGGLIGLGIGIALLPFTNLAAYLLLNKIESTLSERKFKKATKGMTDFEIMVYKVFN